MKVLAISAAALALAILGGGFWWTSQGDDPSTDDPGADAAAIVVPELSATGAEGQQAFAEHCAGCHGASASGTDRGPPLVHELYEPGHHADFAFARAVRQGVPAHHWRFGDMPPVEGVTDAELSGIVAYVRELQRANGIR